MSTPATSPAAAGTARVDSASEGRRTASQEVDRLRAEVARLREALEDVLGILGDPSTYHEDDRTEVAHAVARVKRSLGAAAPRRAPSLAVPGTTAPALDPPR